MARKAGRPDGGAGLRFTPPEPADPLAELRAKSAGPAAAPAAPSLSERLAALAEAAEPLAAAPISRLLPPRRVSARPPLTPLAETSAPPRDPAPERRRAGAALFKAPDDPQPTPTVSDAHEIPLEMEAEVHAPKRRQIFGAIAAVTVVVVLANAVTLQFIAKSKSVPRASIALKGSLWPQPLMAAPATATPPPAPIPKAAPQNAAPPAPEADKTSTGPAAIAAQAPPPHAPALRPALPPQATAALPQTPQPKPAGPENSPETLAALAKTAPAPAAAAASALSPLPAGTPAVQTGAFATPALAEDGWRRVKGLMADDVKGQQLYVEPVSVNGATLYRALVVGFKDRAEAASFCRVLQPKGVTCFVRK